MLNSTFVSWLTCSFHLFIHSVSHSGYFNSASILKSNTTQRHSRHSTDTVSEFHAEAPQATAREGLAQDPYVVARVGVEPTTLRSKGIDSTNAQPRPNVCMYVCV